MRWHWYFSSSGQPQRSRFASLRRRYPPCATALLTSPSRSKVGRPSRFTIQLLRRDGSNVTGGGDGRRLTVFTSPPPLRGGIQDRGDGSYEVELYHEWVTSTSPQHGLSNVTVLLDGHHTCGSPFIFGTDHQFAVRPRHGSAPIVVPPHVPSQRRAGGSAGAYATLVATPEFALGAIVLAHSLRAVRTRFPLVAMLTQRIDADTEALLQHAGVRPVSHALPPCCVSSRRAAHAATGPHPLAQPPQHAEAAGPARGRCGRGGSTPCTTPSRPSKLRSKSRRGSRSALRHRAAAQPRTGRGASLSCPRAAQARASCRAPGLATCERDAACPISTG